MHRALLAVLLLLAASGTDQLQVEAPDRPGRALLALDRDTGDLLWRKDVEPPSAATDPMLVGGVLLAPSDDPLTAYDARTGERLWTLEGLGPVVPQEAGTLVVLPSAGEVLAVEPQTGRAVWRQPLAPDARVFAGPGGVAVVRDRLPSPPFDTAPEAPDGPGEVRLLALHDGSERWHVAVPGPPAYAFPGEGLVAVGALRGGVLGLDPSTGAQRWRVPGLATQLLVAGDRVVAQTDTAVLGLQAGTGDEAWSRPLNGFAAPLEVVDGAVLAPVYDGDTLVLDLTSGHLRTRRQVDADVALTEAGLVLGEPDAVSTEQWRRSVATGDRPALRIDADDDLVVVMVGWGQEPYRD